ncbi:MAG: rod shape-determining protein RodA [Leptospira sp.]|nr:rod shape-determining protein RodA [Leptospira sp.]
MIQNKPEKLDYFLIFSVVFVVFCGVLTLYSQEVNFADGQGRWYKQLIFAIFGFMAMYLMTRINYQLIGSYAVFIYLASIILLILTLIPGIGYLPDGRGARSWIKIGPIGFQASEFAKLATVILLGQYLVIREKEMKRLSTLIVPFVIVLIPMLFINLQPDFGTSISFLPILFAMLFLGGADVLHIGSLLALGGFSLGIPMYIEYSKLTLLPNVIDHLRKEQKTELLSMVSKAQGKIWPILEDRSFGLGTEKTGLEDPRILQSLKEVVDVVIDEHGSILFQILYNQNFLIGLGITLVLISAMMVGFNFARGLKSIRKYYIPIGILGLSILSSVIVYKTVPFRENQVIRLTAFLNPDKFRQGAGYQLRASKPAVGSGKFFGKGLFKGEMTEGRYPHVPEAGTDFIFASWAEQTGFLGSVLLLFFLLAIPLRGLQISFESKDRFGSLLASGIVALIFFHIAINVGIVIGLLPVTGVPLSFVSYGGSHLLMSMIAVGIILSIKLRKFAN